MSDEPTTPRRPSHNRLEEIFGSELAPEPNQESGAGEEGRRRDEEYIENRPPHHDER